MMREFRAVTLSTLLKCFMYHLFIFLLSASYICSSWSLASVPPLFLL
jgi:hypothetical protein